MLAYDEHQVGYYDRRKIFTDIAIHDQIAAMADNEVLKMHLKLTLQHIYMRAQLNNYSLDRLDEAQNEHHLLLEKMRAKDVQGSIEIMRKHIQNDRSHVIACISGVTTEPIDDEDLMV